MKKNELYEAFGELFHCNDLGESDNGVDAVINALFATHTVAELADMYDKLKSHVEVKTAPKELVLTKISLFGEITKDVLENMAPNTMFAHGVVENSPEGVFMTRSNMGRLLKWCAVRRGAPDWSVYVLWDDEHDYDYVRTNGDTVTGMDNVKKLVNCTEEALKMYAL